MLKYFKQRISSIRFAGYQNLWFPCLLPACYQTMVLFSHNHSLSWYLSISLETDESGERCTFLPCFQIHCWAIFATSSPAFPPPPSTWSLVLPVERYERSVARAFNWWYSFQLSLGVLPFLLKLFSISSTHSGLIFMWALWIMSNCHTCQCGLFCEKVKCVLSKEWRSLRSEEGLSIKIQWYKLILNHWPVPCQHHNLEREDTQSRIVAW